MVAHSTYAAFTVDEERLVLKYRAVIQEIGPTVTEFLPHGIIIFFGLSAPAELREISLVHDGTQLLSSLVVGDVLRFVMSSTHPDESQDVLWYRITAIGSDANTNLATLGHVVVHFDAANDAHLPGTISVEPNTVPSPVVGTIFELFGVEEK